MITKKLSNFYHQVILGQEKCPNCGWWMNATGISIFNLVNEEYTCPSCGKTFYL